MRNHLPAMRTALRVLVCVLAALLVPVAVGAAHAATTFDTLFAPRSDPPPIGAPARLHDPTRPTAVVVLGAHGTVVSDALAPYEILAATGAFNLYTVAEQAAPVPLTGGLDVVPDLTFDQLDARLGGGGPQLVVVPAMADTRSPSAAPVTDWLRRTAARGSLLLSVCNGAELLASAGLLDGRRATAHWAALDDYATAYPATRWLRGSRFVEDGADRVTTAGILAGIDGTLRVVERMLGQPAAARAAAAIGWSHWAPGPARPGPQATHAPADAVALLNAGFAWGAPTYGVALTPGVGELELSSVFETYGGQTLATRTVALSSDGGPVVSRHGLVFVPRGAVGSVAVDRLLVPGAGARRVPMPGGVAPEYPHAQPGFAFDGVLTDVARHLDVATARFAAKSMEYPLGRLGLTGPSWPWALLVRVAALAAAGAALGLGLTRKLGRRRVSARVGPRPALTTAESCRTVTG